MADFQNKLLKDILIEKVSLTKATYLEVQPFWEKLKVDNVFDSKKIIIDLSICTFVDSTFKGIIVKAFRKIKDNEGEMKLVLPPLEASNSFKLSGITQLIESFEDLESAIESYNVTIPTKNFKLNFANENFESFYT
ncbi:MAG: STAS domain-containing protein [Ignavibacteria bacterium]|nr:STAS domain-containing protein [Ignavibacteria bacterium]MBT8381170.1 STAS domain-containing protein [Ignavibacteria bacterium]MBT8390423.1 STAS domain-containing protein [Ignavibacteria bacterium]NNJ52320.1 hypothetical protein [Ignavibacteriaceae bacterium]NNL21668.1 hypothetical protein [Ignavibacteriaceae bacterium]